MSLTLGLTDCDDIAMSTPFLMTNGSDSSTFEVDTTFININIDDDNGDDGGGGEDGENYEMTVMSESETNNSNNNNNNTHGTTLPLSSPTAKEIPNRATFQ
eukprot:TRINITY_DN2936_c0_g1_i1.p1 TRINITY_DN2936_c0_g1~~TRINITY_DN2936_c0_g1_i1.p1  ORF type:complete len:101 (+),score=40.51 TRINITY_DN2936_c0_g1_i1:459-761(+)